MPITIAERKHRMPHGAQRAIASELAVDEAFISKAMNDEVFPKTEPTRAKLRLVQEAIAEKLGLPIDDVFPPKQNAATVAA